jgi:hypothetical protein
MTDLRSQQMSAPAIALADRIDATKRSWLPIAGHVVNITISLNDADMISSALRAASRPSGAPEEITGAEMDAIEAAAIAGKPLQSMDIWQAYAAAQEELREANAALKMYRDTNHVLSEELKFISTKTIEACAKIADPWPGFNVGQKMEEPDLSVIEVRTKIAAAIRALAQSPATDAAGGES